MENASNKYSSNNLPSTELWAAFLSGKISEAEMQQLQESAANDAFVQDALEGFSVADKQKSAAAIKRLRIKTNSDFSAKETTSYTSNTDYTSLFKISAMAASFIGVIGLVAWLLLSHKDGETSEIAALSTEQNLNAFSETEKAANIEPAVMSDAAVFADSNSPTAIVNAAGMSTAMVSKEMKPVPPKSVATKDLVPVSNGYSNTVSEDMKSINAPSADAAKADIVMESEYNKATEEVKEKSLPVNASVVSKVAASPSYKKQEITTTAAEYSDALSDYNKGNYNQAVESFDKVITNNGAYKVDARWYKAQALLKAGEKRKARKILKELADNQNPYQEKAKILLKELE